MKKNPPIKIEYHSGKAPVAKKDIKASRKLKVITDPEGQRKHPGKITKIPSGNITMKGIPYPVLGIDNLGNQILMMPDQDYAFPGDEVTEYPMMQIGGQSINPKNINPNDLISTKTELESAKSPMDQLLYKKENRSTDEYVSQIAKQVQDQINNCTSGGCLERAQKFYNLYTANIPGVPDFNTIKNKSNISSSAQYKTHPRIKDYGESPDSWDIQGLLKEAGGKNYHGAKTNKDTFDKLPYAKQDEILKQLPLGTVIGFHGSQDKSKEGYNTKQGLLGNNHSAIVVRYDEEGYPVIFDQSKLRSLRPGDTEWQGILNITAPKETENLTFNKLLKEGKLQNPDYEINDKNIKVDYTGDINKSAEFDNFTKAYEKNKGKFTGAFNIPPSKYNEYVKQAAALALVETEGGNPLAGMNRKGFPMPYFVDFGSTQGITQINHDMIWKNPKISKQLRDLGYDSSTNKYDSEYAAAATLALILDNEKTGKRYFDKGVPKGTNPNLTSEEISSYMWNSPGKLIKGDAQGELIHSKKMKKELENINIVEYQKGGTKPIIVNDPNDPRLKAYQDSTNAYNSSLKRLKSWNLEEKAPENEKWTRKIYTGSINKMKELDLNSNDEILPIGAYVNLNDDPINNKKINSEGGLFYPAYKKPVQPVEYQPPIFEINMPSGNKILKKDFVKQYGEAAWNRATGKFQDGGQNNAAYPIPKKFVAEFNKQQAAAEEYTRKSTGKTLKERQSARGINPYTSKPFATGEAEYFPIESAILPGTPMVKGIGKVANLALDAMNPMAGMRSPGQYYDDVTRQALDRSFMSKASMKNKLDQIGKFYEDPRNEGKFFYTDRMSATDEAFNYAKNYDKEMTMEQIEKLATESPEAFSPYYNDRLKKYYSGEYGEDAVPIFEGRFNQRQPDSNIQGDYFDLTRTGYTDIPSFNQQVNDLKIRGTHGDLTKKHKLGKSAAKDLAEQRALDPDGGIELYNQGRLLDDTMDPNKLKKFRAIDAYQGLQPNKLGGQFDYKGPIANFLKKGGQPTYAEFLDYGHATGPMMFEDGGSTSCDSKFEQGKSTTDNIIITKREGLLKFIRKNAMNAIDKEVRTDIAQMGVDHWNSFQPQSPQFNANQMFGVNPIAMDPNQMSQKFVTSQPQPTDYRRSGNNFGEPGVNAVLTGINAATMSLEERERKMNEKNNSYRTTPDYFSPVTAPFLGDWETNKEVLRPNKMVGAQYQGFQEGGEVYLTQQEIDDLLRNGGQIEYLD